MSDKVLYLEELSFHRNETIFREGNPGGCMYAVQQGSVRIVANYGTQREQTLKELKAGEFFGEMGMVRGYPRSATAVAGTDRTVVDVITWETLGQYFKESPAKIVAIMQQMAQRIGEISDSYIGACGAVAELLEERDELLRENKENGEKIERLEQENQKLFGRVFNTPQAQFAAKVAESKQPAPGSDRYKKYLETYRRYQDKK